MSLNKKQEAVVKAGIDESLKVIAGAGTGKTHVLVGRYLKFVFEDKVSPGDLLALTFTKKAAAEMRNRIFAAVVEAGDAKTLRELYRAWIMNFHEFAFRIIKENAASFGVDPDIDVASDVEITRIKRALYRQLESGSLEGYPYAIDSDLPTPAKMEPEFDTNLKVMDAARGRLWTPEMLLDTVGEKDVPAYVSRIDRIVAIWRNYEKMLRVRNLLHFDDMIRVAVNGLRSSPTLAKLFVGRFRHILVDEFQDTSEAQFEFLRLLAGGSFDRVTVVGDDKQSIYRWRNARVENLRDFTGQSMYLTKNYRSVQRILDLAHRFIIEDTEFGREADSIHLEADRPDAQPTVTAYHPRSGAEWSFEEEARGLGAWILNLTGRQENEPCMAGRPLGYGDIVVLMRSLRPSSGIDVYEEELRRLGIPYVILGGVTALEHRVLELFKNILALLIYPEDSAGLLSLLEARPFSVPDKALGEMFERGRAVVPTVGKKDRFGRHLGVDVLLSDDVLSVLDDDLRRRCVVLRETLENLGEKREVLDLPTFALHAFDRTQFYFQFLEDSADFRALETLTKSITDVIDMLLRRNEGSLAAFVESIQTLMDEKNLVDPDSSTVPQNRVRIMTLHDAKGLEFPAVAVPGIKHGPSKKPSFCLVPGEGLYIDGNYGPRERKNTKAFDAETMEGEQEERCVLYVAMTRAEDHLFISSPFPDGFDERRKNRPTLFVSVLRSLKEAGIDYRELRDAPLLPTGPGESVAEASSKHPPLAETLRQWKAGRDRLEDAAAAGYKTGVGFVGWRGLLSFQKCPLQFYYGHVAQVDDKLTESGEAGVETTTHVTPPVAAPPRGTESEFGEYLHAFLSRWPFDGDGEETTLEDKLEKLSWSTGLGARTNRRFVDKAAGLVTAFSTTDLAKTPAYKREWPLRFRLGNVIFSGVPDRVDKSGDGVVVVDYKVGKQLDEYENQIQFYGWLLDKLDNSPKAGMLCYLHEPTRVVDVSVDQNILDGIDATAQDLVEALADNQFDAKPGKVCGACPYQTFCPDAVG